MIILALLTAVAAHGQRVNSVAKGLKPLKRDVPAVSPGAEPFDTVAATEGMVAFSGYEKTLRANRETVFVSNMCSEGTDVGGMVFTITYTDIDGRLLHRRRVAVHQEIPSGETRRIDFPTWDRQMTFFYKGSPRPRVPAIPYGVTIDADTLLLTREK